MGVLHAATRRKYPVLTDRMAARFLYQATYTSQYSDIQSVVSSGSQGPSAWLNTQFSSPNYDWRGWVDAGYAAIIAAGGTPYIGTQAIMKAHSNRMMLAPANDKLRQRVFYAIAKFFPINFGTFSGDENVGIGWAKAVEPHLLGNFRDLIEAVSKTLQMGRWLSFVGSGKATATNQPDENYAREIMQLFTIGLWELNQDGTRKKTGDLSPSDSRYVFGGTDDVPTYTLTDIRGLARVFTGYGAYGSTTQMNIDGDWMQPVVNVPAFHELGEKTFLGLTIPANTLAAQSLTMALDHLFNHANTPVFFSKAMIQMLTTSNPSPGYISRVAAAFIDNGQGVRGDLKAVWKAILLDQEARSETVKKDPNWGRAFDFYELIARNNFVWPPFKNNDDAPTPQLLPNNLGIIHSNSGAIIPFFPPSVFGHYSPSYSPSSASTNAGRVAPELQSYSEANTLGHEWISYQAAHNTIATSAAANVYSAAHEGGNNNKMSWSPDATLNALPNQAARLERINLLIYGGQMSDELQADVLTWEATNQDPSYHPGNRLLRAATAGGIEWYVQR